MGFANDDDSNADFMVVNVSTQGFGRELTWYFLVLFCQSTEQNSKFLWIPYKQLGLGNCCI
jgi:hypothetical protein